MASGIRGITVEINGNTKKLIDALKETGKETKDIKAELAQVDRLLKLDPSNTELLAQRQELLAQAVEATRTRLDALRQAEKQMEAGFAANAAWEEAFAPLRAEIEETETAMRRLSRQMAQAQADLEAGDISAEAYEKLEAEFERLEARSKELSQAKRDLDAQFENGHISGEEYRKYQRDVAASAQELQKLERQFAASESGLERFSQAAREGKSGLEQLSQAAQQSSSAVGKAADAVAPLSAAAAGIVTAAVAAAERTEELRTDLSKLDNNARLAGVGVDKARAACDAFQVASDELDSSVEATSNLLQAGFTESNLQKAVEGLAGAALSFPDTLKIESLADSLQETLATGQATGQFAELMDRAGLGADNLTKALEGCTTEAQRQTVAMSYLAASGMEDAYQAWIQNNQALVESKQAHLDMQMAMAMVGEAVQPLISSGLGVLADILSRIAGAFASLSPQTQAFIVRLLLLTAALAPILKLVSSIFGAVSNVSQGLGAMGDIAAMFSAGGGNKVYLTFLKWAGIIVVVVALITALVAAISVLTGKGDEMSRTMDSLGGSVGNMTGSLQGGNIPRYASGTDYHPGGLALVGEQGAELLSLPRGSKVWSNGETRRMLDPDGTPPPAGNGDTDALLRALEQGFSRVVRAVQEKDMNTYLDGTRLSRSIGRKQEWLNQTQGTSLVRG